MKFKAYLQDISTLSGVMSADKVRAVQCMYFLIETQRQILSLSSISVFQYSVFSLGPETSKKMLAGYGGTKLWRCPLFSFYSHIC